MIRPPEVRGVKEAVSGRLGGKAVGQRPGQGLRWRMVDCWGAPTQDRPGCWQIARQPPEQSGQSRSGSGGVADRVGLVSQGALQGALMAGHCWGEEGWWVAGWPAGLGLEALVGEVDVGPVPQRGPTCSSPWAVAPPSGTTVVQVGRTGPLPQTGANPVRTAGITAGSDRVGLAGRISLRALDGSQVAPG